MGTGMSATEFEAPSGLPDIVSLATQIWGKPTKRTPDKVLFGAHGSKCVHPAPANTWFDHEANTGGGYCALYELKHGKLPDPPGFPIPPGMAKELGNPVAWWDYHDAAGQPIARVARFHPPGGVEKTYRQFRWEGGRWRTGMKGLELPLYHLPELLQAIDGSTICITEGEKCVDQLRLWGTVATTNAGGAKKFRSDQAAVLAKFDCVICPDNDDAGRKHADVVASALRVAGCTSIRVLNLPNLPPKGDVIDWVRAGGTSAEFAELVANAPATGPELEDPEQEPPPDPGDGEKPSGDRPWMKYLQRNDAGDAVINLANAMTALRHAPELSGCFRFDEMLRVPVLVRPLPKGKPGVLPRSVRDTDVSIVQEWLQRKRRRLGKDIVHQAVALRAEENAFHPVRDYLNGLRWDRKPRLSTWLTYYAGVEPGEKLSDDEKANQRKYISAIGRMFLIAMVARIIRPGCKVDYMLILESIQGEKKSTIGEILAGQWFSDSLPNIGSDPVRISQHLRGKWVIEIGELSAMGKAETEELKSFFTQKVEQFTPKYGRLEVTEPRQCVFMGTTNKATYLRDETGARRFWPAKAGTIDITALTEDRDQLFAEAVNAYRSGEQWWPDRDFEKKFIMPQQEARREADAWEQTIGDWLGTPVRDDTTASGVAERTECTISEVAENALRMEPGRLGTADQRRIAAALEILGWERGRRTEYGRPWVRRASIPPDAGGAGP